MCLTHKAKFGSISFTNPRGSRCCSWWGDLGEPEVDPSDVLHQLNGITRSADELHNAYGYQWAKNVMSYRGNTN